MAPGLVDPARQVLEDHERRGIGTGERPSSLAQRARDRLDVPVPHVAHSRVAIGQVVDVGGRPEHEDPLAGSRVRPHVADDRAVAQEVGVVREHLARLGVGRVEPERRRERRVRRPRRPRSAATQARARASQIAATPTPARTPRGGTSCW